MFSGRRRAGKRSLKGHGGGISFRALNELAANAEMTEPNHLRVGLSPFLFQRRERLHCPPLTREGDPAFCAIVRRF